ncbi:hypothetical protein F5050DRAFT_1803242 [Lentinula boryana]|uniref:DUF6534 domain-containing protein n=1 Tax=Lentinula boryana TaxID=40481 RepID=A0ABQ8QS37_9AGAR|nr:hypothetical protein F5050DRAFT_1803242 [Lentinula boryana]
MSAQAIPTTVQNPIALDLSSSYGALIIAAYISCALWGINAIQTYIYYWNNPNDPWPTKFLFYYLDMVQELLIDRTRIVDTAHKILVTKVPWFTLIQNWGRVSAILASPQEALHEAWVGSIIIVVVQLYYLRRLATFASRTRHVHTWYLWLIFIILAALSVLQVPVTVGKSFKWHFSFTIAFANCLHLSILRLLHKQGKHLHSDQPGLYVYEDLVQSKLNALLQDLKRVGLVAAAVVDVVIAVAMIMLLKDTDSVDGPRAWHSKRHSRTMSRLTVIIVNTGLVTAVVAIISLILDETASGTDFYTSIAQYPQCSIYFSAFLANLNARHFIRGPGEDMTVSNIEDIHFASVVERQNDTEVGSVSRHIALSQIRSEGDSSGIETSHATNLEKYTRSDGTLNQSERNLEVV